MAQIGIASSVPGAPEKSARGCLMGINAYTSVPYYKNWIKSIAPEAVDTNCNWNPFTDGG